MRRRTERPADGEPPRGSDPQEDLWTGLRRTGPAIAWSAALAAGATMAAERDLLEVALRAAAVWIGALALWQGGAALCERIVAGSVPATPGRPPSGPEETAQPGEDAAAS